MYGRCLLQRRAVKERKERCFNCKEMISDVLENEKFVIHEFVDDLDRLILYNF